VVRIVDHFPDQAEQTALRALGVAEVLVPEGHVHGERRAQVLDVFFRKSNLLEKIEGLIKPCRDQEISMWRQ